MTFRARVSLFLLSAICTVIVPAVLSLLYQKMQMDLLPMHEPFLIALGVVMGIAGTVVLLTSFVGMFSSLFRAKHLTKSAD